MKSAFAHKLFDKKKGKYIYSIGTIVWYQISNLYILTKWTEKFKK